MRYILLIVTFVINTNLLMAQEIENCSDKCSRSHLPNSTSRINYYQYSTMDKYDVKYLKIDISAETASRVISGNTTVYAASTSSLDSFVTELKMNMIVDSVFINGSAVSYVQNADHLFVNIIPAIPSGNLFQARIFYHGTCGNLGIYAGTVSSNGLSYFATLSESYQAREWFPCKQILTDKIDSADIWITTSIANKAGSNGSLQGIDTLPSGKVRYRWKSINPMNYYMPSIAIGNYREYVNYAKPLVMAPDSIKIQHYIADNTNYFNTVKVNIDRTPVFLEKMSELFGLYPFYNEKYGHCQASIGGGMEHQTMSTMNGFGATLIAHELGHQWWGDAVTCASWNDIWMNEGFASYCEYLMIEKLPAQFPTTNATTYMQNFHTSAMSQTGGSVFVPDGSLYDENRIFSDRLSYKKGAAILHNLRFELQSDTIFFNCLKNFQVQYKDSVASTADFKLYTEQFSGKNLTSFFNQWYYGEGYPTFNITYFKPSTDTIMLLVNETVSAPNATPFFSGLLELKISSAQGDTTVLVNLTSNNQIFKIFYSKNPSGIVVDPNNWMLNKTGTITNGIVVPVRILAFNGSSGSDCYFRLQLQTTDEFNVMKYQLQSSTDGLTFNTIDSVLPYRLSNNNYTFTIEDKTGLGQYFRVKIINVDGSVSFSNLLTIGSICKTIFSVTAAPVPFVQGLELAINLPKAGMVTLKVLNAIGQTVCLKNLNLNRGLNRYSFSAMDRMSSGSYNIIVIDDQSHLQTLRVIKK
jgi:aminopeptidase N